ncbi:MAG: hypothetical protein V2A76_00980 [Planctomycetota bacterium]
MMHHKSLLLALLPVTLCLAPLAGSQTKQDEKPASERDPFQPPGVIPTRAGSSSLPALVLRGYVEDEKGAKLALIEAGPDSRHIVGEGESFLVRAGNSSVSVAVAEMSGQNIVLEVGPAKTRLELR